MIAVCVENMKQLKNNGNLLNIHLRTFKNIKEANETLQELIKNFKRLENIYKSNENQDGDSSDSEIDQISDIDDTESKDKLLRQQAFTTNYPSTSYQGTAHIYEYQETSESKAREGVSETEEVVNVVEVTREEKSLEKNADTKETETSPEIISVSDELKSAPDEIVEIKFQSPKKIKSHDSKPNKLTKNKRQSYPLQKKRFSGLHSSKDSIQIRVNSSETPLKLGNQRILYSEQFSPDTIWNEIINRPIKLNRVISSGEISQLSRKENEKHTTIIIADNTKKEYIKKSLRDLEKQPKISNIATDGDSTIRSSYGDVCLKAPIKKCKKALKTICKTRFKCKSEFKSDFNENSKTECVKEFSYTDSPHKDSNNNSCENKDENQHIDGTRYRHLDENNSTEKIIQSNNSSNSSILPSLRDKYERRCQKESRAKCIAAGHKAVLKTCSKHTCVKKKKKALNKACKEECKNFFAIDNSSSESNEDSDNSDSDSD